MSRAADAAAAFIAMIEDAEALENLDAIIATEGLDAVFIGRVDLSVAIGAPGPDAPEILKLCEDILAAARKARKPAAVMVAGSEDARRFADMGASVFLAGSDQAFMRQAGARARADIAGALAD